MFACQQNIFRLSVGIRKVQVSAFWYTFLPCESKYLPLCFPKPPPRILSHFIFGYTVSTISLSKEKSRSRLRSDLGGHQSDLISVLIFSMPLPDGDFDTTASSIYLRLFSNPRLITFFAPYSLYDRFSCLHGPL